MASREIAASAFERVNPSSYAGLNSSFSIKNILNLPDENTERAISSLNTPSSPDSCLVSGRSLVPRGVCQSLLQCDCDNNLLPGRFLNSTAMMFSDHLHVGQFDNHSILPLRINISQENRRRTTRKRKQRPLFSPHQIQAMEEEFAKNRYLTQDKRATLAKEVNLTDTQVKTWFQNRRTKWRKERLNGDEGVRSSRDETRRRLHGLGTEGDLITAHGNRPLNHEHVSLYALNSCVQIFPPLSGPLMY